MSLSIKPTVKNKTLNLKQEFLLLTERNAKKHPIPVFLLLVLIAILAYGDVAEMLLISWILLAGVMLFGRIIAIRRMLTKPNLSDRFKIKWIYILNAGNGITLGISLFFFPYLSDVERAYQTLLIGVLCTGVVASNAGLKKATLPYLTVTLIPLSLVWIFFPSSSEAYWKSYLFSGVILIFGTLLLTIALDNFRLFKNAVEMRLKNAYTNARLEKALEESKASNAAKTRFLASASHDLRQPVHTLSLLTAALMSRNLDSENAELCKNMDQSLQGLAKQLDALLDVSKLDAGIVVPQWSDFNLAQILQRLHDQFIPLANQKNLKLTINNDKTVFIYSDSTLLERIFNNLITNAIKYSNQGEITIDVEIINDVAKIFIADTGIGIAKEKQELVYEEFYQLQNPHRERTKGLGLGLSIVRRLTRLLNINMTMNSKVNIGTEFTLELPVSKNTIQSPDKVTQKNINFDHVRVLVIDDEEEIRIATQVYLQELNCEVFLAESSLQAIDIAKKHKPHLVIADYRLRDNDSGLKAIEGIRKMYSELPAIIITGDTAPDRLQEASQTNAQLLHKPINTDELKLAMQEALASAS